MDWLKNIVTPFSERVKSPFYSTLVISWLAFNWKIIVALFFYDELVNHTDKITYIVTLLNDVNCAVIYPLITAFVYIFILPKIDEFVFEYVEKSKQKKLEKKIDITKAGVVNGERHIDLYNRFMKLKDELGDVEDVLRKEKEQIDKIKEERDNYKDENYKIQERIQESDREINLYHNRNQTNFKHKNRFHFKIYNEGDFKNPYEYYAKFTHETLNKIDTNDETKNEILYEIIWLEYLQQEQKFKFLCVDKKQIIDKISLFDLKYDGKSIYEGTVSNLNSDKQFRTVIRVVE